MAQTPSKQGELFEGTGPPEGTVVVNGRCVVHSREGFRIVVGSGVPLHQFAVADRMAEAYSIVSLIEQGWATQVEVAVAFGRSTRSVRRYQDRFARGGLAALGRGGGYPAGRPRLPTSRTRLIERLKAEGHSNRAIAARVGITEKAVRKVLRRLGWKPAPPDPSPLLPLLSGGADPNVSGSTETCGSTPRGNEGPGGQRPAAAPGGSADPNLSGPPEEPLPITLDEDPTDRRWDRLLAFLGFLDDAAPLFSSARRLPRAGVLLALPGLLGTGALDCAREVFGDIGPAFYGLRTSWWCWSLCFEVAEKGMDRTDP